MGLVHFFFIYIIGNKYIFKMDFFSDYVKQLWLKTMKITIFPIARNIKKKQKKTTVQATHTK